MPKMPHRFQPTLEALEDRRLLSITYGNGPLLRNVEVETFCRLYRYARVLDLRAFSRPPAGTAATLPSDRALPDRLGFSMITLQEVRARFARDQGLPFADALTERHIREALDHHGIQYRNRLFNPSTTIWGFLTGSDKTSGTTFEPLTGSPSCEGVTCHGSRSLTGRVL
jgi:hypothetical protein